ncbi:DNA-deoxyinosine glycosylase [Crenobacter cavernae]|uniref:DNA-deoxyinosine glycosylase n=1 Tax=Crenobacter cavernae TaxID=2290923 RepID=A0ABY0FH36_9NEIS|nr:DNA-deoxyinosine glycosylase [Crenobacter cavernae]RXZ45690.1 DNA-deoxyinosine glycosylase [Crenobacter cavernae]
MPDIHPFRDGLPPVVAPDTRLLILGSLPGEASLAAAEYYAHPRNAFWTIMAALTGEDLVALPYAERLTALLAHRVGLWDVVGRARRRGSLDTHLREVSANPLADLIASLPALEAVAFNGATAARLGQPLLPAELARYALPSTSPAHTMKLDAKLAAWRVLAPHIGR